MSDLGLRYGEEFRPIRELSASGGKSTGRASLSQTIAGRAADYPLHPVLFDGALQTFSAGAATVENRTAGLRLPVRFARILFLRSPGASCFVKAGVQQANEEFVEGDIDLYDETGRPCVRIDGFRAISVEGGKRTGRNGKGRDVTYHVGWEKAGSEVTASVHPPVPLDHLREVAQVALDEVLDMRGRNHLHAASTAGDELTAAQIASGLREMGVGTDEGAWFTANSLGVSNEMRASFHQLVVNLVVEKLLTRKNDTYQPTPAFVQAANCAPELLRYCVENYPGHLPESLLCGATCAELGAIMRGEKEAVQVLFSGSGAELLDQFYGDGLVTSPWLAGIGRAVEEAARNLPEGRGLRILEIGAGTGGLASQVLPLLERGLHCTLDRRRRLVPLDAEVQMARGSIREAARAQGLVFAP